MTSVDSSACSPMTRERHILSTILCTSVLVPAGSIQANGLAPRPLLAASSQLPPPPSDLEVEATDVGIPGPSSTSTSHPSVYT